MNKFNCLRKVFNVIFRITLTLLSIYAIGVIIAQFNGYSIIPMSGTIIDWEAVQAIASILVPFTIGIAGFMIQSRYRSLENSNEEHIKELRCFVDKYGASIEKWRAVHEDGASMNLTIGQL